MDAFRLKSGLHAVHLRSSIANFSDTEINDFSSFKIGMVFSSSSDEEEIDGFLNYNLKEII